MVNSAGVLVDRIQKECKFFREQVVLELSGGHANLLIDDSELVVHL